MELTTNGAADDFSANGTASGIGANFATKGVGDEVPANNAVNGIDCGSKGKGGETCDVVVEVAANGVVGKTKGCCSRVSPVTLPNESKVSPGTVLSGKSEQHTTQKRDVQRAERMHTGRHINTEPR